MWLKSCNLRLVKIFSTLERHFGYLSPQSARLEPTKIYDSTRYAGVTYEDLRLLLKNNSMKNTTENWNYYCYLNLLILCYNYYYYQHHYHNYY